MMKSYINLCLFCFMSKLSHLETSDTKAPQAEIVISELFASPPYEGLDYAITSRIAYERSARDYSKIFGGFVHSSTSLATSLLSIPFSPFVYGFKEIAETKEDITESVWKTMSKLSLPSLHISLDNNDNPTKQGFSTPGTVNGLMRSRPVILFNIAGGLGIGALAIASVIPSGGATFPLAVAGFSMMELGTTGLEERHKIQEWNKQQRSLDRIEIACDIAQSCVSEIPKDSQFFSKWERLVAANKSRKGILGHTSEYVSTSAGILATASLLTSFLASTGAEVAVLGLKEMAYLMEAADLGLVALTASQDSKEIHALSHDFKKCAGKVIRTSRKIEFVQKNTDLDEDEKTLRIENLSTKLQDHSLSLFQLGENIHELSIGYARRKLTDNVIERSKNLPTHKYNKNLDKQIERNLFLLQSLGVKEPNPIVIALEELEERKIIKQQIADRTSREKSILKIDKAIYRINKKQQKLENKDEIIPFNQMDDLSILGNRGLFRQSLYAGLQHANYVILAAYEVNLPKEFADMHLDLWYDQKIIKQDIKKLDKKFQQWNKNLKGEPFKLPENIKERIINVQEYFNNIDLLERQIMASTSEQIEILKEKLDRTQNHSQQYYDSMKMERKTKLFKSLGKDHAMTARDIIKQRQEHHDPRPEHYKHRPNPDNSPRSK